MRSKGIASAKTLLSRAVLKRILHLRLRRRLTGLLLIVRFLGGSGLRLFVPQTPTYRRRR